MGIITNLLQNNMDSDDDVYLCECLQQEEKKIIDRDPILFTRPDGLPMAFENLDFDYTIKKLIEEHGGIVVDSVNKQFKENTIKICSHDSTALNVTEDAFDKLFIYDCLRNSIVDKPTISNLRYIHTRIYPQTFCFKIFRPGCL